MIIELEMFVIWFVLLMSVGGIIIWRHGESQYGKGILDGIQMYDSGRLTYHSYYEGDQKYLTINIEPEDEE